MRIHGRGLGQVPESVLTSMFELRHREFKERLGWDVRSVNGLERDEFDDLDPVYLIEESDGVVGGSVRLLPTTGPNMLRDVFSQLAEPDSVPASERIWECSRFVVDGDRLDIQSGVLAKCRVQVACYEFARLLGLDALVAVYSRRMHAALVHAGCEIRRIGRPRLVGKEVAMVGLLPTTTRNLELARDATGIHSPVLQLAPTPLS